MLLKVRFFASLADKTGCAEESIEIDQSMDLDDLWRLLLEKHQLLRDLEYLPLAACDMKYSKWDRRLVGVSEVALLPPVSGG